MLRLRIDGTLRPVATEAVLLPCPEKDQPLEQLLQQAQGRRPELAEQAALAEAAAQESAAARYAPLYPTLGATAFAGGLGGILVQSIFKDPGPNLRMMVNMMRNANGVALVGLAVLMCVVPPFVEETLFRGYIQRRLLERWQREVETLPR